MINLSEFELFQKPCVPMRGDAPQAILSTASKFLKFNSKSTELLKEGERYAVGVSEDGKTLVFVPDTEGLKFSRVAHSHQFKIVSINLTTAIEQKISSVVPLRYRLEKDGDYIVGKLEI